MRAIIFFQCVLIFFMNSQFVFSAEAASSENRSKCLFGHDRKQAQDMEIALKKAIEKNDHATVFRYFLESRAQFTKFAPFMSLYTISSIGAVLSVAYFISDVIYDAVNQNEIQDYQIMALTLPALWSAISLPVIALQAPIVYRSYKTKEKAKAYLVKNLGHETFRKMEKLKLGETFDFVVARGAVNPILEDLEQQEDANVNGLSTSNTAGMMLNFMFLGPFKLLNIVSTARPFNRSRTARPFDRSRTARPFDCSRETFSKDKRKS